MLPEKVSYPIYVAAYGLLFTFMLRSLWMGPFSSILGQEMTFIKDFVPREDLEATMEVIPDLTICRAPGFKAAEAPLTRASQVPQDYNFTRYLTENYHFYFGEVVQEVSMVKNVRDEIKLKDGDNFKRVMTDHNVFGFCYTMLGKSFKEVYKLTQVSEDKVVFSISAAFRFAAIENGTTYAVFVHDHDESKMFSGLFNIPESKVKPVTTTNGISTLFNIRTEYHENLSTMNCEENNVKLSQCVDDHLDATYGDCTSSPENVGKNNCSVEAFIRRHEATMALKLGGLAYIESTTKCRMPCNRMVHKVEEVIKATTTQLKLLQRETEHLQTVMRINHFIGDKIIRIREVPLYSWPEFIADLGGNLGLFLGLSFWEVFKRLTRLSHGTCTHRPNLVKAVSPDGTAK